MKAKTIEKSDKLQSLDGPPLDFSFKNIRSLAEIQNYGKAKPNIPQAIQQQPKVSQTKKLSSTVVPNSISESEINENVIQTKLNIIRTIEIMDNKILQASKNGFNKKMEKEEKKHVKKIEVKTSSLFLRYNKLVSIEGLFTTVSKIFPQYSQLIWIDLSHNRLTNLVLDFEQFQQLKNLYLHANYIANFKEFEKLINVKLLRTFTIHGNPIEEYNEFRVLISCILPQIQKIDSTLLTKRQRERGQVLQKQNKKYPLIQNPHKPPQQSDNEEQN